MRFFKTLFLAIFMAFNPQLSAKSNYQLDGIPDHAPLSKRHDNKAERFINLVLKTDGNYDLIKARLFLERVRKEKKAFANDLYQEELIFKLENRLKKLKKAKKSALDEINEDKKSRIWIFTKYLIPTLEIIVKKIESNSKSSEIDSYVDAFLVAYSGIYFPEKNKFAYRFREHVPFRLIWKGIKGYKFKRYDPEKVEANNLALESPNLAEAKKCLKNVKLKVALTPNQVKSLMDCGFDISRLNPIKSALWRNLSQKNYEKAKKIKNKLFPKEGEKIIFNAVKYSGAGSPKLSVYTYRENEEGKKKKKKFKLKIGREVHSEPMASSISKILGFHQDPIKKVQDVKVYLGDKTYDEFIIDWQDKYSGEQKFAPTFIKGKGIERGEHWIIIRNALFEGKDPKKVKTTIFHPDNMDFPNKREFRGSLLFQAWINLIDSKDTNYRINLVDKDGKYLPELSYQDVGSSFMPSLSFRPKNFFKLASWISFSAGVNGFTKSIMEWNDKEVDIYWNDVTMITPRWKTTTYLDLKWMARKIAAIPYKDIAWAVKSGGAHPDVQDLYVKKLAYRRNQFVRAFNLEDEFSLFDLPNLETYSPNKNIKNGKLTKKFLKGQTRFEGNPANIQKYLLGNAGTAFGLIGKVVNLPHLVEKLGTKISDKINLSHDFSTNLIKSNEGPKFSFSGVSAGIRVTLTREVGLNPEAIGRETSSDISGFFVKDRVSFELHADSGINFKALASKLPVSVQGQVTAWKREFEMVQFGNSWLNAYKQPFNIAKAIMNTPYFVGKKMRPEEVFKISDSWGFGVGLTASHIEIPMISHSLTGSYGWKKVKPLYFYRDSFGELHIYRESNSIHTLGLGINAAELDLFILNLPLIGMDMSWSHTKLNAELFTFKLPAYDLGTTALSQYQRELEMKALYSFMSKSGNPAFWMAKRDMELEGSIIRKSLSLKFLALFKIRRGSENSEFKITLSNGKNHKFYRYKYSKSSGAELEIPIVSSLMNTKIKSKNMSIRVEMEGKDIGNSVGVVKIYHFDRFLTRKWLDTKVKKLNKLYSDNPDNLFFSLALPPKEELNKYKFINTYVKIYVNGNGVLKHFNSLSKSERKNILRDFFNIRRTRKERKRWSAYMIMKSRLGIFKKRLDKHRNNPKKLTETIGKILKSVKPDKYGVVLYKKLFGEKNVFVFGHFKGLRDNFSVKRDPLIYARSWGEYKVRPPLTRFMRKHSLTPITEFVEIGSASEVKEFDAPMQ